MTAVRIPPVLRTHVGDAKQVVASGATVGELVDDLVGRHPGLADQLRAADGGLHRFVNVYLNGQDVRYLDGLSTPVGERDTLVILPAMAGGSSGAAGGSSGVLAA
ncbi:MoaD/ThiS family protein [soil metagenome]